MTQTEQRFLFRGSAVAFAGHIRRPDELIIPSQASALVPVIGGYAQGVARRSKFGEVVQFAAASSDVAADFEDLTKAAKFTHGNFADNRLPVRTTVKCSLSGLRVSNSDANSRHVLTCDSISASVVSRNLQQGGQPSIKVLGASMEKLALDGFELNVKFHTKLFASHDTKDKLSYAYEEDETFFSKFGNLFLFPAGMKTPGKGRRKAPQVGGIISLSMVQSIKWVDKPNPDAEISGNRITLRDFGSIFLGELLVSDFSKRLTMMRLQVGSPIGGEMACVELDSNGHTYPP